MKKILTLTVFAVLSLQAYTQTINIVGQIDGNWGSQHQMNNGQFGANYYYYLTLEATGDYSNAAFLFEADSYYNKWNDVDANVNVVNTYTWHDNNGGTDNHISSDVSNGNYYTFRLKDNGYASASGIVMETSADPISILSMDRTGFLDDGVYYASVDAQTVPITISVSKSAEENIYLRYSTDNWVTDNFVLATGTGTEYSADIPAQSSGTTISYYVLSTTLSYSGGGDLDTYPDLCTISSFTNAGSNYSYTASDPRSLATGNWNSTSSWVFGAVPSSIQNALIIAGDEVTVNTTGNTIGSVEIENTASLIISAGKQLTVTGSITNNSSSSGVTLNSDATGNGSLIFSGSGPSAVVGRYIEGYSGGGDGWHLLSSPVNNYTITSSNFEPGATDDFFAFDEPSYTWLNQKEGGNSITSFENGKGYLVAYESTVAKNFFGTLNSSDITFTSLTFSDGDGWHLLGNPFSSALIWNKASGGWNLSNFVTTAKVWSESGGNYLDIATGEVIPSTNGFFVQATSGTNSITIKETSRTHHTTNNYKSSTSNLMHLTITNDVNSFYDKNRIGINNAATEAFDLAFDSHKLYGNSSAPQLASKIGDEKFSINYLPELISNYDLNLEFKAGIDANYQLLFEGTDSFDEDIFITLEDIKTQVFTDLKNVQKYNFTGSSSDDPDRFVIHFFKSGLGIGNLEKSNLSVYTHNSYVMVQNQTNSTGNIQIFDLSGKKIFENTLSNQELSSYRINAPSGAYIIHVQAAESTVRETIIIAKN